jgi:uncharacterized protein (TIGR00369 family)
MDIPAGFERHFKTSSLTNPWEPIYSCKLEDRIQLGLPTTEMHTNSRGFVHGGLITALADNAMGLSCAIQYPEKRNILTMNLSVDFVSVAKVGQWLLFDSSFSKLGNSVCFAQCFVTAEGKTVARASGVFKA